MNYANLFMLHFYTLQNIPFPSTAADANFSYRLQDLKNNLLYVVSGNGFIYLFDLVSGEKIQIRFTWSLILRSFKLILVLLNKFHISLKMIQWFNDTNIDSPLKR